MSERQEEHAARLYSILPSEHFEEVKELMEIALGQIPSDEEVKTFLLRHVDLLGMIVQYNEVETEARRLVWEYARRPIQNRSGTQHDNFR